jgi:hypothetical protein
MIIITIERNDNDDDDDDNNDDDDDGVERDGRNINGRANATG